jgi:hypothetical protein
MRQRKVCRGQALSRVVMLRCFDRSFDYTVEGQRAELARSNSTDSTRILPAKQVIRKTLSNITFRRDHDTALTISGAG